MVVNQDDENLTDSMCGAAGAGGGGYGTNPQTILDVIILDSLLGFPRSVYV